MADTNIPQVGNDIIAKHSNYKKSIIISIVIVVIFAGAIYFFLKYKKSHPSAPVPITKEEKIDILNKLTSTPPKDGSTVMTVDERKQILDRISKQKADPSIKKTEISIEQQNKIFDSIE